MVLLKPPELKSQILRALHTKCNTWRWPGSGPLWEINVNAFHWETNLAGSGGGEGELVASCLVGWCNPAVWHFLELSPLQSQQSYLECTVLPYSCMTCSYLGQEQMGVTLGGVARPMQAPPSPCRPSLQKRLIYAVCFHSLNSEMSIQDNLDMFILHFSRESRAHVNIYSRVV